MTLQVVTKSAAASWIVTVTSSVTESVPSFTVSRNVNWTSEETSGAANVGMSVPEPVSVTAGEPPVCAHEYVMESPLASEAVPDSATANPSSTLWSGPASIDGGLLPRPVTVMG